MSTLNKPIVVRVPWPSSRVEQARALGWSFSIVFHAAVIAAVAWFFPYWAIPQRGVPNGNGTSLDLTLLGPGDSFAGRGNKPGSGGNPGQLEFVATVVEPIEPTRDPATAESEMAEESTSVEETPQETEFAEPEPVAPNPNLRGGRRLPDRSRGRPSGGTRKGTELASAQGDGGTGGSGRAMGGTRFFGLAGAGKKFVYVIDCSSSMRSDNAIGVARAELDASLRDLDPSKQFQVIVYNMKYAMIPSSRESRQKYLAGTEANRAVAMQFIKSVIPDGGTDRFPALKKALELKPDVVFFLTDADFPILEPADMERIRQMNRGVTQIHVIEFGKGGQTKADNFLKVLAHQNHGTYTYHDVLESQKSQE